MEVDYSDEQQHREEAGVDTCSSCMTFSDPHYFEVLDLKKHGNIKLLDCNTSYDGVGIVAITFQTGSPTYRFPAYYMARENLQILSNKMLCDAGIVPVHGPGKPHLKLPDGLTVPMRQNRGI